MILTLLALLGAAAPRAEPAPPVISYTLRLDAATLNVADVEIRLSSVPETLRLAMKVHAEYDAHYWRFLDGMTVTGTANDAAARVTREDSTVWRVTLPGGKGVVHYRVHIQPPTSEPRRAWMPYARADGAFINSPDFFLYVPELSQTPATLDVAAPADWHIATSLSSGGARHFRAANAVEFLDSPLLMGHLRQWSFAERGTTYPVIYWPLPDAAAFDTVALVDELHRLARAATDIFGHAPTPRFLFLLQDGAGDALEHAGSVTLGVPSAELSRDARAPLTEIAHEFFHAWNLVAIHPAGYNVLSYRPPLHTPSLWLGEGVTIHYADVLRRRAGLADSSSPRHVHVTRLLERYLASPAILRTSPERASSSFGDSPVDNPDATGGYYLQGELLANALDALVKDSTRDQHGLDGVMRALFERPGVLANGYTPDDVAAAARSTCRCDPTAFFAMQVRGAGPIDLVPLFHRLGWRLIIDSVPAADTAGTPLADTRLGLDFSQLPSRIRAVITISATPFARAGIQTADDLVAVNGQPITSFADWRRAIAQWHVGDHVAVDVRRAGAAVHLDALMTGYLRPRVRLEDLPDVTRAEQSRRAAWLAGN